MRKYFTLSLPRPPLRLIFLSGFGGFLAIALLSMIGRYSHLPLIIAPFGASCVLLFSAPAVPLSQPLNIVGGHVLTTLIGLIFLNLWPDFALSPAIAVGIAIAAMVALRIIHPPAGGNPLVVFAVQPGFDFVIMPVLMGAVLLVVIAVLFHRVGGTEYPVGRL
ncbi:MAG: HPP family protein [Paracoccus sp. (in: a-proteobacteria)]|uniref:HPP family protein n=1 Tax=Paracoccus sp. TaxID=267 RepID=UPI0026E0C83E|nr:HPP family protein [Paracoccus sp. (in: a-proteobacteria)]MDO5621346.1 HPP family protein [Paracoccus sp. (in: a-proteobacteria)]